MRFGEIDFGDPRVTTDHFQSAMAKNCLQGQDVAATPQVGDGESVPESVGKQFSTPALAAMDLNNSRSESLVSGLVPRPVKSGAF